MYWSNPLIETRWPCEGDPLQELLGDQHCLFWQPEFDFNAQTLICNQNLYDICEWANLRLAFGAETFVADELNHYVIANLVKMNLWAVDIRRQGIVKPWLILDWGDGRYEAGTGDTRLRICEVMPEIRSVKAFVSTHRRRAHLYQDLEPVRDFDRFAELCGAEPNLPFLFRPTDAAAPFGLYWYEYDTSLTRPVTPSTEWCVGVFANYIRSNPVTITPQWILHPVPWHSYDGTVQ